MRLTSCWKRGRHREIGHFTLAEALILQRSLDGAIADLKALHAFDKRNERATWDEGSIEIIREGTGEPLLSEAELERIIAENRAKQGRK